MSNVNAKELKDALVGWIRYYFGKSATPKTKVVIGISGGTDSSVVAAACVEALGADRVIGVLMPNGYQKDIYASQMLVEHLGIKHITINIKPMVDAFEQSVYIEGIMDSLGMELSSVTTINTPARVRMATLYAVAGSIEGGARVANTCNLSEDWVGYSTKFGDAAGDFSPLMTLTKTEVKMVGVELGLPEELVYKIPTDGLCGKTDEENLGFTYEVLDKYIRTGVCEDTDVKEKIDRMHNANLHKLLPMPRFTYNPDNGKVRDF